MIKRLITAAIVTVFALSGANAQLLYKISGKDLKAPSYIIGTHHLADASFIDKITGVKEALANTQQVYGELQWDVMTNPDSLKMMQEAMMLPSGQDLQTILSTEQYKKLNECVRKIIGIGLDNPQVNAQIGKFSPAALSAQLTTLQYLKNHHNEFDLSNSFDQYFQNQAKKNNKPIGGLETMAFQIEILFKRTPLKRQVEQLMCFVDNQEFNEKMTERITKAFYAQELNALKTAMDTKLDNSCDYTPEETAQLIDNRNRNWAQKMQAIMATKPTFFAVGAGHLPGERGLLQLLKNAGYTVEAVK